MNNWVARLTSLLSRKPFHTVDDKWRGSDMVSYRDQLAQTWLKGDGIEIGALHDPIQLKSNVSCRYVDYKAKAENRSRYPELEGSNMVETEEHLREFLSISDGNIRRMNQIAHLLDDAEVERSCAAFMQPLANAVRKSGITYDM